MSLKSGSSMSRLGSGPRPSLGASVGRPAPAPLSARSPGVAAPKDLLDEEEKGAFDPLAEAAEDAAESAYIHPAPAPSPTADDEDAPPAATEPAGRKERKPRGPSKAKVTLGPGAPVDLAALRASAKEVETRAKDLAAEYQREQLKLKQDFEPRIAALRDEFIELQRQLADALFRV